MKILTGDALTTLKTLPDESVQCCVTSPPYWGLRDYGVAGQLGLEPTPDEYVARMVEVFREVRRVLRGDGTLWLNMGDCYAGSNMTGGTNSKETGRREDRMIPSRNTGEVPAGLKPKDLCGIPWRLAFALQADGWWLRQDIIWAKPNPMPESVTDRCTKAHEYLFLLSKAARYYHDAEAIREPDKGLDHPRSVLDGQPSLEPSNGLMPEHKGLRTTEGRNGSGANARSVWTIATAPFPQAHFATFPPELPRRCIAAGTSDKGCCAKCGAPRVRISVDSPEYARFKAAESERRGSGIRSSEAESLGLTRGTSNKSVAAERLTTGWRPPCSCDAPAVPCVVLDPFAGAGTTLLVADRLGRDAIGIELNPAYVAMAQQRIRDDAPLFAEPSFGLKD